MHQFVKHLHEQLIHDRLESILPVWDPVKKSNLKAFKTLNLKDNQAQNSDKEIQLKAD